MSGARRSGRSGRGRQRYEQLSRSFWGGDATVARSGGSYRAYGEMIRFEGDWATIISFRARSSQTAFAKWRPTVRAVNQLRPASGRSRAGLGQFVCSRLAPLFSRGGRCPLAGSTALPLDDGCATTWRGSRWFPRRRVPASRQYYIESRATR